MSSSPIAACVFGPDIEEMVLGEDQRARLGELVSLTGTYASRQELQAAPSLAEVEVLITGWGAPCLDEELLAAMPSLRAVFYAAGSVRHMVTDAFWARDITLVSAADANNDPVAEFVLASVVLALKGVHRSERHVRRTHQVHHGDVPGIYGQRVGLVSFGSIARKVAAGLHRFGSEILVWDPYVPDEEIAAAGARRVAELPELFSLGQVVSVHAPWIPGVTDGMIGEAELERLPRHGTFINTARGALVDEEALVRTLKRREDLQAILDVTWPEPPPAGSPLYDLANVQLTGHVAGSLGSERRRLGELVVDELERWLAGSPLQHRVDEQEARLRA